MNNKKTFSLLFVILLFSISLYGCKKIVSTTEGNGGVCPINEPCEESK